MTVSKLLLSVSVIAILFFSTVFVAIPITPSASAQQKVPGANWEYVDYDQLSTSFNPQTQINKDNVNLLELKWIFPYPQTSGSVGGYTAAGIGATPMPLVVDGIVYTLTNYGTLFALDAATGKTVWTYKMELNITIDKAKKLYTALTGVPGGLHGYNYFEGKLYFPAPPCDVHVIDALTGKLVRKQAYMCDPSGIQGIAPDQPLGIGYKNVQSYGPVFYRKGRVMIVPDGPVSEDNAGGRGFLSGYNVDTGQRLWRFYVTPPHGGDPDWAIRDADKGWIQGIKTSEILQRCRQCLENDWGKARWVNAGPAWGQWPIDEETGIAYVATAQPAPDWNATYRPGPNLFASSVIALDAITGQMKWYHQTTTHDLWDWDCAWSVILGKIGDKKVVFKGCKNGVLYAFDALDGKIIWSFNSPFIKRCPDCAFHDPTNLANMRKPWTNYPSKDPFWQNPAATGAIEADTALAYGNAYVAVYNNWWYIRPKNVDGPPAVAGNFGGDFLPTPETRPTNTTIYALDAATGRVKWSFFMDRVGYRGGLVASGGLLYTTTADGNLNALDAETGKVVWNKFFGSGMIVPPAIAADAKGRMMLFQIIGRPFASVGQSVPGAIMAFGLPDKLPEPQVITKEVIKEVVKEVPKEVVKEVIKEVPKEVIKEVPKEVVKEVIKEVPKTVTVETISPITYVGIGLGIIGIVVGAVISRRRQKPA